MSHACSLRSGARGLSAKLNLVVRNSGEIRKKSSLTTSRLGDAVALPFFTPSVASSCQLAIVANCGIVTGLEPPGELLQGGGGSDVGQGRNAKSYGISISVSANHHCNIYCY